MPISDTIKLRGKTYYLYNFYVRKSDAERVAKVLGRKGYYTHIKRAPVTYWLLYRRHK